jgi:type IV secretory pathway VirB2 component (pilin)
MAKQKVRSYVRGSDDYSEPRPDYLAVVLVIAAVVLIIAVYWRLALTLTITVIAGYGIYFQARSMIQR